MSMLTLYDLMAHQIEPVIKDPENIRNTLAVADVLYERWETPSVLDKHARDESILEAYKQEITKLQAKYGFQSADVIHMHAEHPEKEAIRARFLSEHVHSDFEVRFFVEGQGLFYLRAGDTVHALLCEKGDLISVPAGMPHWFDMGSRPQLTCIRLFTDEAGWIAQYTEREHAKNFPDLDQILKGSL